jgi:hypothetical protein
VLLFVYEGGLKIDERVERFHGIIFSTYVIKTGQLFYKLREKTDKRITPLPTTLFSLPIKGKKG